MKRSEPDSAFFATYLPIYLDYLAVEKGLAKNSLSAYGTDLRRAMLHEMCHIGTGEGYAHGLWACDDPV